MGKDEQPEEQADIQVVSPEVRAGPDAQDGPKGDKSAAKKALDMPKGAVLKVRAKYKHLNNRDKMAVLIGVLVIIMTMAIYSIWYTGGGMGGPSLGPEILPPSDWNMNSLTEVQLTQPEENTNMAGQATQYLVPLTPNKGEIYFVTGVSCQVNWADETTPPTQAPAVGYTNQPDGFQLKIRILDDRGEWESELVFNSIGSSQSIPFEVPETELGAPIAVANPEGARYLPQGYVESLRVDFIVWTDECGPWTSSDPFRPTLGDGGNHFTFDWFVTYRMADSTRSP